MEVASLRVTRVTSEGEDGLARETHPRVRRASASSGAADREFERGGDGCGTADFAS